ncbi:MAG: hypothetical protein ACE362_19815 [Phaeodactylibacter xiamenensis]|uniref:hypothetical protein n=1 Tax=Phaeodactylibacter xiamenensis TaxID=1524460 RepID=UPI001269DB18|nr:hypothetical protein [Phaeodactylibacter xiamenensis]MCR9054119.1 hypothetical protein [bacterium]
MKYLLLLLLPYLIMVVVNEVSRWRQPGVFKYKGGVTYGVSIPAINPSEGDPDRCTWRCHDDTEYCLNHHVEHPPAEWLKGAYFGIIRLLAGTGAYGLSNVLLLGAGWPFMMLLLLIGVVRMRRKIKSLRYE